MSHVRTSPVCIQPDPFAIACLKAAVGKIKGLHWKENQKTFKWYGSWVNDYDQADAAYKLGIDTKDYGKCEHAISVDGSGYEIGLMKRKDGKGYSIVWDFFGTGRHIEEVIGKGAEKLLVAFDKEYVTRFANMENMNLTWNEETKDEALFEMEVQP